MPTRINVPDFDLAATLECGQAFRWTRMADGGYVGVVSGQVWRLRQLGGEIEWHVDPPHPNPLPRGAREAEVCRYLGLDLPLAKIVATFPDDIALQEAVRAHWGLHVLRQEPWETLASFIASSTKQIVQIRQIVAHLARCFGEPIDPGHFAFPGVDTVARASLDQLLACKLGFRAKHLLAAARLIDSGEVRLADLPRMEYSRALEELEKIPGVGEKIANCTLLFSCGFDEAFPVDVWVQRSIQRLYFPRRKVAPEKLRTFTRSHFGPYGGWAQQYLFYAERRRARPPSSSDPM